MESLQIRTLGCSKNTVDTEHVLAALQPYYEIVPEDVRDGRTDVVLINTCGFIGDAKEESIEAILEAVSQKSEGLIGRLFVFGCLSQRYPVELPESIPEVDGWFGARDFNPMLKALGVKNSYSEFACDSQRLLTTPPHYAYLKISEGCDRRCSYCAIPHIRGAHKSVPIGTLVAEAETLARSGVRELIVIAQDTTYYGLDLYHHRALARLLEKLCAIDGIEWIRIHYSYPESFPEDVLELMAREKKICPYMDIPLQHISDKVLSNMHRHSTGDEIRALIGKFCSKVPGIVLRTTLIVGHPGEGEEEFGQLLDFVREARFERLGAFIYSEEEGTWGAEHLEDSVPSEVKAARLDALMTLQAEISLSFNKSRVGTRERVIVDSFTDGTLVCRSRLESPDVDGEILVRPEGNVDPWSFVGEMIDVEITGADEYDLIARML
ncbi:MAG: 30S ribosomal protein S12 methylthiotransferase RimO [Bacteroidales bacterium]|nr:30S ribosomal protein S12 methylthiotransferase RimO [Bacteroidales bacterium]